MKYLIYFILIAICVYFVNKFLSRFKFAKIGALAVFVGGVKSGKSATSLACSLSNYKRVHRYWVIKSYIVKLLNYVCNVFCKEQKERFKNDEEPLFYSTIPLRGIPYVPVTREHLLRKRRFRYKSVVFIDEASLVADSQLIQDKKVNSELLLFFKLFGHETHGGKCIVNTHCITDLHFALKRCTSQYFYIHHLSRYIPFVTISYMREERYSEDGANINAFEKDVEEDLKRCLMWTSVFKKYDSFCFSYLTDNLPVDSDSDIRLLGRKDSLKATEIVSFRKEFYELSPRANYEDSLRNYDVIDLLNKEIIDYEKKNS